MRFVDDLRARRPLLGSFVIELPARATIEAYARSGHDFVVLDLGPDGLMVPGVESAAQAAAVVAAARYAPLGRRGLAPMLRHDGDFAAVDATTAVVLQIEGTGGVAEAAAIAATPGIDAVFIGPYDLSQALGVPGRVDDERVMHAGRTIAEATRPHVCLGVCVADAATARRWRKLGATLFARGTDGQLLLQGLRAAHSGWDELLG